MQRPLRYLIILCLLLPFFIKTEQAYACSCAPPDPPDVALGAATAVFSGKVTNVVSGIPGQRIGFTRYYPFIYHYPDFDSGTKITFETTEIWKGEPYQSLILNTGMGGGDCGLGGMTVGSEYVVYAYGEQEFLRSNICTRTRPLANASKDLIILGTGAAPTLPGVNEPEPASLLGWAVGSCTAVLALTAATFLLIKRRRAHSQT